MISVILFPVALMVFIFTGVAWLYAVICFIIFYPFIWLTGKFLKKIFK